MPSKEPFKDIECEHLIDSQVKQGKLPVYDKSCLVASEMAGFHVPAISQNCKACLACDNPKSDNMAVKALIAHRKHEIKKYNRHPEGGQRREKTTEQMIGSGPGTELSNLLPKYLNHKGCGCKDYARKMNLWGVDGCIARFDKIVDYLVKKGNAVPLLGWIPSAVSRPVAKRLVTMAIEKCRKAEKNNPFKWFTAVTTSPRPDCTLKVCVDSLRIAGFNPMIFAEPESTKIQYCETFVNKEKKGVWYNWLNSCEYALNHSSANVIMTVQDDSLFHPDSKTFAEKILWPAEDCGFLSLYTPKHYSLVPKFKTKQRKTGINRVYTRSLWGACALIWPREILEAVMQHKVTKSWLGAPTRSGSLKVIERRKNNPHIVANSDTAIGKIMNQMKRSMWFVDPSAVEHIAVHSTISHGGNGGRRNCSRCAKWSTPLEDQVPVDFEPVDIKI